MNECGIYVHKQNSNFSKIYKMKNDLQNNERFLLSSCIQDVNYMSAGTLLI